MGLVLTKSLAVHVVNLLSVAYLGSISAQLPDFPEATGHHADA